MKKAAADLLAQLENVMKYLTLLIILALVCLLTTDLNAKKVYPWTDEKGNVHITDEPPPEGAKVDHVDDEPAEPEKKARKTDPRPEKQQNNEVRKKRLQEAQAQPFRP